MQKFILAVSPDEKLLMQIQAHLQEGGRYSVVCVSSGKDALSALEAENFDIAILDGEISDLPFVTLTREMVSLSPELKFLVFPPQNNPRHPALTGLLASGYLNKPFFGPEVSEKIAKLVTDKTVSATQATQQDVDVASAWIKYPEIGVQQIEQLLAATTATAGLLLLHGQVLASSGILTQESSTNIINYLNRYWSNIQSGELFRYLTMEQEATSYIIYAAPLIRETAIGLVYNAQRPLPEIRSEVMRLRKAFVERYATTRQLREDFPSRLHEKTAPIIDEPPPPREKPMNTQIFKEMKGDEPEEEEGEQYGEALSENELQNLNSILSEMPLPDPDKEPQITGDAEAYTAESWQPAEGNPGSDTAVGTLADNSFAAAPDEEQGPASPQHSYEVEANTPADETPTKEDSQFPNFDFKLPWEDGGVASGEIAEPLISPGYPAAKSVPAIANQELVFPYTFLLFPANPSQFITRDLGVLCNKQLPVVLKSFGWQLQAISVRPLYLQWSALLPIFCNIPEKLGDVQLQLNTLFFNSYPELLQSNPDGEFWLSSYLGLSGLVPPSNRMINDFITLFRQPEPQTRPN